MVELWGRALDYEEMFEDSVGAEKDVLFLELVRRVSAVIQAEPGLARQDAPQVVQHLLTPSASASKL